MPILLISALRNNPDLLIAEEPLSGLDVTSALIIKNLIQVFSARGKSIFYCSHILEVVEKVCTHLIVLRKGQVIAHGATSEVRERIGTSSLEGVFLQLVEDKDVTKTANEIVDVVVSLVSPPTARGAAVLWRWAALFLDRRDYTNLLPLPLSLRAIFFAILSAILALAALFTTVVNAASLVLFPIAVVGSQNSF